MHRVLLSLCLVLAWALPAQAQFVHDTFTGVAGTNLNARTGETGATWDEQGALTTDLVITTAGTRARSSSNGHVAYFASGSPASADYDVTCVIHRLTNLNYMGCAGRMVTTTLEKYVCVYHYSLGEWHLQEYDSAGTGSTLDTAAATLTDNTNYTVKLEMRGTTIKCFVGGVEVLSATDGTLSAAGKAGIFAFDGAGATSGYHLDEITATDAPAAPSGPPLGGRMLLGVGR